MTAIELVALGTLLFCVASLYASVGHGGASGYLAILAFFGFAPQEMATTALTLNLLVAGSAFVSFRAAGHLRPALLLPFVVASIPAAFVGGALEVPARFYTWLLGLALVAAAARLAWRAPSTVERPTARPRLAVALPVGGAVGLLSGIVGVGGGIFLSPLLLLARWGTARETAAVAAGFIVLNSAAGLLGRTVGGTLAYGDLLWLLPAAMAGGFVGAWAGAYRLSSPHLRRLLAVVLVVAALKLLLVGL